VALVLIAPLTSVLLGTTAELRASLVSPVLCLSAVLVLTATVSLWLMLSPSAAYRRWVERRDARAR
jgi:small-conductance mechanosensitive channel